MSSSLTEKNRWDRHGLGCGLLLIAFFFLPNIIGTTVLFPTDALLNETGPGLAARLVAPVSGALLTLVSLVALSSRMRARIAIGIGVVGTFLIVLPDMNYLPISAAPALAVTVVVMVCAALLKRQKQSRWMVRLVMGVPIVACLIWSVIHALSNEISFSYLIIFKTPLEIYLLLESALVGSDFGS